ncbi:MAG TPA: hypothetical protein VGP95_17785 [Gemmatimonadaceae bacterium]|jgi:hypothetical protein|nr:hypothetical protein [Gemmatimonadaceae bacterium]
MAQRPRVQLDVAFAAASAPTIGATVSTDALLGDSKTRELLHNGFPARIHYRLELWRIGGWSNERRGITEWDVLVAFDPAGEVFNAVRRGDEGRLLENYGGFPTVAAAEAQIGRPLRVDLHPDGSGRFYYNLVLDVQTLTVSDLDALQQWLRGPEAPSKNPLKAIRNGIGTLVSRLLGGDKRHYERRSDVFTVP